MRYVHRLAAAVLMSAAATPLFAAPAPGTGTAGAPFGIPKPQFSITHHSLRVGGETLRFTATAGSLVLHNDKDQPTATMFFVAYTADGVSDESSRPVTFLYNGGPGSSSIWLEMGAFGPKRVETTDAGATPPPPYKLVDNGDSLLDRSDLVFIDAPGTGFSRVVGAGKPKDFYSVDGDGRAFTQFIRGYLDKYRRWNSPRFLLGESYGTTRSAVLAEDLQQDGVALNGVILLSSILNFQTASFNPGNDLPYVLYLPTYAASAYYHKALPQQPKDFKAFIAQVEQFATGAYAGALRAGSRLDDAARADVLKKLHRYTGLSEGYWSNANLRVNNSQFEKELLRGKGKVTGRLDSRYTGWSVDLLGEDQNWDPMSASVGPAFAAAFHRYLQGYLGYTPHRRYRLLSLAVNRAWTWKHTGPLDRRGGGQGWPGYVNVAPDLALAMTQNPHLQVMVNSGYYDLGTPFFATDYTFDHLFDPVAGTKRLQDRVHRHDYASGHMIYLNPGALKRFKANVARFIERATSAGHG